MALRNKKIQEMSNHLKTILVLTILSGIAALILFYPIILVISMLYISYILIYNFFKNRQKQP